MRSVPLGRTAVAHPAQGGGNPAWASAPLFVPALPPLAPASAALFGVPALPVAAPATPMPELIGRSMTWLGVPPAPPARGTPPAPVAAGADEPLDGAPEIVPRLPATDGLPA